MSAAASYQQRLVTARLLHRFNFGPRPGQYAELLRAGLGATQETVLTYNVPDVGLDSVKPLVLRNLGPFPDGDGAAATAFWNTIELNSTQLVSWWLDRMAASHYPLRERMTWFWHGHWATSISGVSYPLTMQRQNDTLRNHALGNFLNMAKAMVLDGALNVWLSNNENYIESPNENLAREFMELMTLGVNNYTQHDVTSAALALTGYSTDQSNGVVTFNPHQHYDKTLTMLDFKSKQTAETFAELAVSKRQNARFITDRLWFRFVSGSTKPPSSLAGSFSGRDIAALVRALATSPAFASPANALVKSPVEWFVGSCRALRVRPSTLNANDTQWLLSQMGQVPFNPPNVGGWTYGTAWLSGVAFQYRFELATTIVAKADLSPLSVPKSKMVEACADWLGVPEWSRRTSATLSQAVDTPAELALAAILSPEYMVSA